MRVPRKVSRIVAAAALVACMLTTFAALGGVGSAAQSAISAVQGQYGKKVTICHKGKTITVSKKALPAHLRHGDTVGTCAECEGQEGQDREGQGCEGQGCEGQGSEGQGSKGQGSKGQGRDGQAGKGEGREAERREVPGSEGRGQACPGQAGKGKGPGEVTLQPVTEGPAGGRAPRFASTRGSGSGGRTTCPGRRPGSSPAACRIGRTAHRRARTP